MISQYTERLGPPNIYNTISLALNTPQSLVRMFVSPSGIRNPENIETDLAMSHGSYGAPYILQNNWYLWNVRHVHIPNFYRTVRF
jgi:hypothetical protein